MELNQSIDNFPQEQKGNWYFDFLLLFHYL